MKCNCCGRKIDGQMCDYCGFINTNTAFLDFESAANELNSRGKQGNKDVDEHRKTLLSKIRHLNVTANAYKYDSDKEEFVQSDSLNLFDDNKTGIHYFGKTVWSKEWIANPSALDLVGKKQTIPFSYTFSGITHNGEFVIESKDAEGVECHLGLMIDDNLNLNLFLGNHNEILAQDVVELELIQSKE